MSLLLADVVVLVHLAFVLFAALGGLLALQWRRATWVHLPAVAWGAFIEISGGTCPLTPLENRLREAAGETGYEGDFIGRYLLPFLYPEGLTRDTQLVLAALLVGLNVVVYSVVWRRRETVARPRSSRRPNGPSPDPAPRGGAPSDGGRR